MNEMLRKYIYFI